ncbi:MAG: 4-amino-4-deoxychorismate lyase [Cellvibrionaceae bacterium]|jgi:4-amino-4-deoxychorismate lyase
MSFNSYPIISVNGRDVDSVSVNDRGLVYGDGVFETVLIVRGEIPLWPLHHERLLKGLVLLKVSMAPQRLRQAIDKVLETAKTMVDDILVMKLIVTRGESTRGYQIDPSVTSTLITQLSALVIDAEKHNGVSVHFCQQALMPNTWGGLKTLNQLPYVLAAQERLNTEFDEGLLFSLDGELIEATSRNVFLVKGDEMLSPIIDKCGVAGVMRQTIMDKVAAHIGMPVVEQQLFKEDLLSADEIFLTNSITGIWPVIQCEEKKWSVGPVTRSLQAMCHGIFFS